MIDDDGREPGVSLSSSHLPTCIHTNPHIPTGGPLDGVLDAINDMDVTSTVNAGTDTAGPAAAAAPVVPSGVYVCMYV